MSGLEQLLLFITRAPSAQALLDTEMRYLAYSDRWVSDYGLDPDQDYLGRSHYDVFPEIGDPWKAIHRRCLQGHIERNDGEPFTRSDGTTQWLRSEVRPWHTSEHEIGGLVMLTEDLTSRVGAAADIRQRDALVAAGRDVEATLWAFDADRRMTLHVGAPLETLGVGQGWNVGEDMTKVYADLPVVVAAVEAALRGERSEVTVALDGRTFETVVSPMLDDEGAVCGGVGISLDVTDREQAQRQNEAHADHLQRLLLAVAQEGSFAERAEAVLREMTEMLGLEGGLLATTQNGTYTCLASYGAAMSAGDTMLLRDTYCALTMEAQDVVAIEHMAESEHRDHRCYQMVGLEAYIGVPVRVDGRPDGALSFSSSRPAARPFTPGDAALVRLAAQWAGALIERHQREQHLDDTVARLAETRDQAEQANRTKSAFLASMSHEIRTPMNAVIGFGELLTTTHLDALQRSYVETIRRSGERLLGLIDDILDFSKIEAGRIELDASPVDLGPLVQRVLQESAPAALGKGIELAYAIDPDLPARVLADEKRLQQILANLVSNAVKFTEAGTVDVAVRRGEAPAGSETPEGDVWVTIEVHDSGIGIDRDRLEAIFDPFVQADASMTRAYGGAGLGLAITRRFVELMGGFIGVESEAGVGSVFRVRLPLERAPTAGRIVLADAPSSLAGARVLVVDDDEDGRAVLVSQLRRWNVTVTDTPDPHEALGWIRDGQRFDVGVLDMQMPITDGLELAEGIRQFCSPSELPLVILSSEERARHAPDLVASTVLKPIAPVALHALLRRVLNYGGQPRPSVTLPPPGAEALGLAEVGRQEPPTGSAGGGELRILLVEDEPDNQALALQMLSQLGHRADVASDGLEALERLEQHVYDLVLMDVMMPRMDGLEATRCIRREVAPADQPKIVALTARALRSDREACLLAGMDGYLSKPVRLDALTEALRPAPAGEIR